MSIRSRSTHTTDRSVHASISDHGRDSGPAGRTEAVDIVQSSDPIDWERPGTQHYRVAFPLDGKWGYSLVPLTVINGYRGRSEHNVLVIGGTHGNEWEGQIAARRLADELDPRDLSGRVIIVPQLSPSACAANSRSSPLDGVNMNRAFPGDPKGTISFRIAHFVYAYLFPQVRVVIDVHSGGRETQFPFVASYHPVSDPVQRAEMAAVAKLFDTPFIMVYSSDMASGLLTEEAEKLGKITIGTELGFGESVDPQGVRHAMSGVRNVLRHYDMCGGDSERIDANRLHAPRIVEAADLSGYIPAPRDGVWEPRIAPGTRVVAGELIGFVHDVAVRATESTPIHAPIDGTVLMMRFAALTETGDTLFSIGKEVRL